MDAVRLWYQEEGIGLFKEATTLSEERSKSDPVTEPYRSKYKAREIWHKLKNRLEDLSKCCGDDGLDSALICLNQTVGSPEYEVGDQDFALLPESGLSSDFRNGFSPLGNGRIYRYRSGVITIRSLLVVLAYELGVNHIECEEVQNGEEYLQSCTQLASAFEASDMFVSVLIAAYNQLSIVSSNRGMNDHSLKLLKTAEHIYKNAVDSGINNPFYFEEVWYRAEEFLSDQARNMWLEKLHTLTLYYLAQVYGALGNLELAGRYCHVTLARQMLGGEYDPIEWSLNCATLSQYYVTRNQFPFARYCLACAEAVNKKARLSPIPEELEKCEKDRLEELRAKSLADVYRCWAKYGLNLLKLSHAKMLQDKGDVAASDASRKEFNAVAHEEDLRELLFGSMDVVELERQVADRLVGTYQEAKAVFQFSQVCLAKAKDYYKLDGFVSDFVEIVQDISQFYKYLAFFEVNFESRCKMHKRRVDMLSDVLQRLNPQHFLQICRQLTFEIAEAYSELADLKKAVIEEGTAKLDASKLKKVNFLLLQSIKYYQAFLDSYKRDGRLPATYEEDAVRGVLVAFFCMARVYSKYLSRDKSVKGEYMRRECDCYRYIVDYCDRHSEIKSLVAEELSISEEMIGLFSVKMSSVLANLE